MFGNQRHASIVELLGAYLTFTPTPSQVEQFAADMRSLNPALLRDAIKEATRAVQKSPMDRLQQRVLIHSIYTRKTKELASLYPVIFALENGIRSALADFLSDHFNRMDWWVIVRDAHLRGDNHKSFVNLTINGCKTTADFIKQAFFTMEHMFPLNAPKLLGAEKTDEFFYCLTIGDLTRLKLTDWTNIRRMFRDDKIIGFTLDRYNFKASMDIIRDARNGLYHSNPISNRKAVYEAGERILNALDFHLGDFDADIGRAHYNKIPASVLRTDRHQIPAR